MTSDEKIDVKIVSKIEAVWTNVAKEAKALIEQSESNMMIQKAMLELAEQIIAAEKAKDLNTP